MYVFSHNTEDVHDVTTSIITKNTHNKNGNNNNNKSQETTEGSRKDDVHSVWSLWLVKTHCSCVALITINGNDGISSPRRAAACVCHSTCCTIWWRKRGCMIALNTHTHIYIHIYTHVPIFPQPFFFTHLVFFLLFFFLNSSLFSSHVYFYPSVPREESEKWRGLGRLAHLHGNYILQKSPHCLM